MSNVNVKIGLYRQILSRRQQLQKITEADWNEVIAMNLKPAFLMIQACLPDLRRQKWGRIVNLSSAAAQLGGIVGPHYAASKAGLHGLTHYFDRALAKEGITLIWMRCSNCIRHS